ncbi:hypothetical protein U1Q18_001370 [Sarracenia purpurea var. burkii]
MAPKRIPLEDPPSASSSEEESEEITDMEEDRKQQQNKENTDSEEEEEESEDDGEEEEEEEKEDNKKPSVQKLTPMTTPQPQSPSDSESSDSEIRSGETQPSPTASDFTIKPIVSKPMEDSTKPKKSPAKPPAKPSALTSKPAAKLPSEKNGKELQQKLKSKVSNGYEDEAVEEKKSAIHRLWSEDDEIVILKGMIDYQSKRGTDPNADMGAFHEFIKKSLHVEVSKNQLMDKIRRLKIKYKNNVEKGEKGEEPVFSKPHDHKSFDLSKKIWSAGANNSVVDGNANKSTNKKARKSGNGIKSVPSPKEYGQYNVSQKGLKVEEGEVLKLDKDDFFFLYPRLKESLDLESFPNVWISEPGKNFMKEMMSKIGTVKAKELEEKWEKLRMDEVALYLKRVELTQEETKLALEAVNSSKS